MCAENVNYKQKTRLIKQITIINLNILETPMLWKYEITKKISMACQKPRIQ